MIECVSSKIFLFECHRCGVHIYSDRSYTQGCGCFFCGERLMPIFGGFSNPSRDQRRELEESELDHKSVVVFE